MGGAETIYAISTGAAVAGVAVIRVSGPSAGAALAALAAPLPPPRSAELRKIRHPDSGEVLDHGLVLWFPGPRSFTGEDLAEFHVHGSRAVTAGVLEALAAIPGCRPAEAGEFSLRAFKNGKMDLFQAEALGDLIAALTAGQRRLALSQSSDGARAELETWRRAIMSLLAHAEAVIDFSDDDGAIAEAEPAIMTGAQGLAKSIGLALAQSKRAQDLRDGLRIVIAGPPNAGKSSLLNRLARRDAAIVSAIPGTTRDIIDVQLDLDGVPVVFSDTAGLRPGGGDEIEREGMARASAAIASAHAVLWVQSPDARAAPSVPEGLEVFSVLNKSDLAAFDGAFFESAAGLHGHVVSTVSGAGLDALVNALSQFARLRTTVEGTVAFSRRRQEDAARQALFHLKAVLSGRAWPFETLVEELRGAAHQIGRITGRVDVEDLLDAIFSEFCIGK